MRSIRVQNFNDWRNAARDALLTGIAPDSLIWFDATAQQQVLLFTPEQLNFTPEQPNPELPAALATPPTPNLERAVRQTVLSVPKAFLELAQTVSYHRDENRWNLLYRTLWRITAGEPHLLKIASDDDTHRLGILERQVRRDAHKMKAFVRFRKCVDELGEHFVAWHRPDHRIVRYTAPFFQRRYGVMRWTILTPDESVTWDQTRLQYGPGVPREMAPPPDELETLWKEYYGATFNPARIKIKMMKSEMPVRYWSTLPETEIIENLLKEAPARVAAMIRQQEGLAKSAKDYLPSNRTLPGLAAAAVGCEGCTLHAAASQTVFGEGPEHARLVIVGEQPGDEEDLVGRPFVGPSGQLLNQVLQQVGLDRSDFYVTNAVKHFKFESSGNRRLHKKADTREISACRWWLQAELDAIRPDILVCLGATAAQSLLGRDFKVTQQRGTPLASKWAPFTLATYHPSALLRQGAGPGKSAMEAAFKADWQVVANAFRALPNRPA